VPLCAKSRWKFNFEIVAQSLRSSCVHQLVNYANASCASRKHDLSLSLSGLSPTVFRKRSIFDFRRGGGPLLVTNSSIERWGREVTFLRPDRDIDVLGTAKMIINWAPCYPTYTLVSVCRRLVELCKCIGLWQTASRHVDADEAGSATELSRRVAREHREKSVIAFVKLEDKRV